MRKWRHFAAKFKKLKKGMVIIMIELLFLYPDLLNLYGDHANVLAVRKYLEGCQKKVNVCRADFKTKLNFADFDAVFVGSGTESAVDRAIKELLPYKEEIVNYVENGGVFVSTGTSMEIFAKNILSERDSHAGLGIFGYNAKRDKNRRILVDIICESEYFDKKTIGFANRCSEFEGIDEPLFKVVFGVGCAKNDPREGIMHKNFIGSTLTGPLLVRNPHLLEYVCERISEKAGEPLEQRGELKLAQQAYEIALSELEKRASEEKR